MVAYYLAAAVLLIVAQRSLELCLARRNRYWALANGAHEFGARHYPLFFFLHGGWLVGLAAEAQARGPLLGSYWPVWLALFIAAQVLRYWCIASLGRHWNTRILVIPGANIVRRGPYRYIKHPNYLAVAVELLCLPLVFGAWITALAATVLNAGLLLGIRIPAEERALELIK